MKRKVVQPSMEMLSITDSTSSIEPQTKSPKSSDITKSVNKFGFPVSKSTTSLLKPPQNISNASTTSRLTKSQSNESIGKENGHMTTSSSLPTSNSSKILSSLPVPTKINATRMVTRTRSNLTTASKNSSGANNRGKIRSSKISTHVTRSTSGITKKKTLGNETSNIILGSTRHRNRNGMNTRSKTIEKSTILHSNQTENQKESQNENEMNPSNLSHSKSTENVEDIANFNDPKTSFKNVLNSMYQQLTEEDLNQLMAYRSKASKFNQKAKCEEQIGYIRRLRGALKQFMTERKTIYDEFSAYSRHEATKNELEMKELESLRREKELMHQQNQKLEEKVQELLENMETSSATKDRLLNDKKEMVLQQQEVIQLRLEAEEAKIQLSTELTEQKAKYEQLMETMKNLKSQLDAEKNEKNLMELKLQEQNQKQEEMHTIEYEKNQKTMNLMEKQWKEKEEMYLKTHKEMEIEIEEIKEKYQKALEKETQQTILLRTNETDLGILLKQKQGHEEEIMELKTKLERKDLEVTNALETMKQIHSGNQESKIKLEEEKRQLQERLHRIEEEIKENVKEKTRMELEFEQQQKEIQDFQVQIEQLSMELKEKSTVHDEIYQRFQEKEREAAVDRELRLLLDTQLKEVRTEATALTAQMEAVKFEKKLQTTQFQKELENMKDSKQHLIETHLKEHQQYKMKIEQLEEEIVSKESELRTLRESATSVREEDVQKLCEAQREVDVLRLRLKELSMTGKHSIEEKEEMIRSLEEKLQKGENLRRKMHNTIQELRGNVRVFARTRPFLPSDEESSENAIIHCHTDGQHMHIQSKTIENAESFSFAFDKVFSPSSGQDHVFEEVSEFVQSALDGYHVCLFSYGQTGSGKTHTMQGSGNGTMRGIIPRSIEKVIEQSMLLNKQGWKYSMEVTFLEIYNESIRDLLVSTNGIATSNGDASKKYQIKKDPNDSKGVYVSDLNTIPVQSIDQIEALMEQAARQRSVGTTDMNAQSSRSHSVFTLHLRGVNDEQGTILKGKLNLVDLAGSERLSRSKATGDRLKETQAINKSLSCLTDVFSAISNKSSHIPFRNSKLTYLLQQCLSGDGKTLMMVNLSPTSRSYHESLCSLRFAKHVNQCELGKPRRQVKTKRKEKE